MQRPGRAKEFCVRYQQETRKHAMFGWIGSIGRAVGRRGSYLLFLAMLDFAYGYSLTFLRSFASTAKVDLLLPINAWIAIWWIVGTICLVQAFMKMDRVAYSLAVALKVTWGLTMLLAWVQGTSERGWVSAVIFIGFGLLTSIVSYWPEQRKLRAEDF